MAPPFGSLRLRPLTVADEAVIVAAHRQMAAEHFTFALRWRDGLPWAAYLALLEGIRVGTAVPEGLVPAAFLVAEVDGEIIGRASVRYALNELLAHEGGHLGYCVLPAHRRRGHATEILRQSLIVARAAGVERILVACDDDNVGSRLVIERCGGKLENIVTSRQDQVPVRRYWIGLPAHRSAGSRLRAGAFPGPPPGGQPPGSSPASGRGVDNPAVCAASAELVSPRWPRIS